jgi:dihydroorotate dehydrogenase (NAD+) catalytic subunit
MGNYIDGVSVTNTMPATIVDRNGNQAFPGPGREKAGVSGSAIKWAGIDMVNRLKHLRESLDLDYAIIGIGGVMNPQDYNDYIIAGADAVQSATAAMWNPDLATQIKNFIHAPYIKTEHVVLKQKLHE